LISKQLTKEKIYMKKIMISSLLLFVSLFGFSQIEKAATNNVDETGPKGTLSVQVKLNRVPVEGKVQIFKVGTKEEITIRNGNTGRQNNPVLIEVPDGQFDVKVSLPGKKGVLAITNPGVVVTASQTKKLDFDFISGFISLNVVNAGEPHEAKVKIRIHGERRPIVSGLTIGKENKRFEKIELDPGIYDIIMDSDIIKGNTSKAIIGRVHVKAEETTSLFHEFKSAEFSIDALSEGKPCEAVVNIVSIFPLKPVAEGRVDLNGRLTFNISPGEYEVTVEGINLKDSPVETFKISLKNGDKITKVVKF
jgi:hypothetical protein